MSKQVLDVQQMQHLQELGLELKKDTIFVWARFMLGKTSISDWEIAYNHSTITDNSQTIPAYALQDVLDALPKMIYPFPVHKIGFELWIGSGKIFYANMFNLEDVLKVRYDKELIDAAYELLVWCVENKFVETDKNE